MLCQHIRDFVNGLDNFHEYLPPQGAASDLLLPGGGVTLHYRFATAGVGRWSGTDCSVGLGQTGDITTDIKAEVETRKSCVVILFRKTLDFLCLSPAGVSDRALC